LEGLIGKSAGIVQVRQFIERIAPTHTNLLITGESGTGKELVARTIHKLSPRSAHPFVVVSSAGVPDELLESSLFGHVRGAFASAASDLSGGFKRAEHGTMFLDEVGELSPTLQIKLLRVLYEKTFNPLGGSAEFTSDARIVCASKKNLKDKTESGQFREDLFYNLYSVPLWLPPLRDRKEDIPLLLTYFLEQKAHKHSVPPKIFSSEATEQLTAYHWPGNVSELESFVERLTVSFPGINIGVDHLPTELRHTKLESLNLTEVVDAFERDLILDALKRTSFVQTRAASLLGITERGLRYKIKKLNIREDN